MKFNGEDSRTAWEHVSQYVLQLGEAGLNDALRVRLFFFIFDRNSFLLVFLACAGIDFKLESIRA